MTIEEIREDDTMTTINNLTIEQMRKIVESVPDTDMPMHYNITNGVWIMTGFANHYFVDGEWKSLEETNLGQFEFKTVSINELRTAIAEHDSRAFKVADLVVDSTGLFDWLCKVDYLSSDGRVVMYKHDKSKNDTAYQTYPNIESVRHATPLEIKAGHRIDLKPCIHGYDIACLLCGFGNENGVRVWRKKIESDEVTDIRNHVSPSTLVWDLASGEDWTAEAERHG